ncbi:hypothetical protein T4C_8567 [Trichinella pseudospiralis]|uniref:Uncharacterized protein n=1 Tax=Trichinella pseudospiralis TaxID=6337 RepID=A0A0V1J7V4_TRIPS|nr:hypothetical protein T4C_8567 [Trichinella pseudospiralis]
MFTLFDGTGIFYYIDIVNGGKGVLPSTRRNLRISIVEHWKFCSLQSGLLSWIIGKRQNHYDEWTSLK